MSLGSLASMRSRLTKIHPLSPMKRLPFSPSAGQAVAIIRALLTSGLEDRVVLSGHLDHRLAFLDGQGEGFFAVNVASGLHGSDRGQRVPGRYFRADLAKRHHSTAIDAPKRPGALSLARARKCGYTADDALQDLISENKSR